MNAIPADPVRARAELRAFNRTVTERIGVLEDQYLGRGRSLALDRLLWEIGADGADVLELRERLGLDSGYLSRMLRALEHEGLVVTGASGVDSRVRRTEITAAGRAEISMLDRLSDDLADAILEPLTPNQQSELLAAAATTRRLLTASAIEIAPADPDSAAARRAIAQYYAVLTERFELGFDPATTRPASADDLRPPAGRFLIATLKGTVVGCVGVKLHPDGAGEIKRLWVAPEARGMGLGRRLLTAIEDAARQGGSTIVRLDTNRSLTDAIQLYRTAGYSEIPSFNDEPYAHHGFQKHLTEGPPDPPVSYGRVGFIGLGLMGTPMARRLVNAGIPLTAWTRSPAVLEALAYAGATPTASAGEVFATSDTVIMMLRNAAAINAVLRDDSGSIRSFVAGRTVVNTGTIAPADSRRLAEEITSAGGTYVESPVSGSRVPAETGTLVGMIAGPPDAVERVLPLLEPLCSRVEVCGDVPAALTMKLSTNVFLISVLAGLAESFHFAGAQQMDLTLLRSILDAGQMASPLSRVKTDKLVRDDMTAQSSIADVHMNAELIREAATAAGIALPVIETCARLFADCAESGDSGLDAVAIVRTLAALSR
ncbi:GNAT family N-acetyltransferase [Microbacterium lacus]|uniref:GNAT family N-acetyltransferase n=1 Tax=Microbacterium lacus TaxID=415217 RepID=UPI0018E2000A|nr:GNAT family N-acetyltransferase [Microbacterium lacus]